MNRYEKYIATRPKPPISIATVRDGQELTREEALVLAEQLVYTPGWHCMPWPAYVASCTAPFQVVRAHPDSGNTFEIWGRDI